MRTPPVRQRSDGSRYIASSAGVKIYRVYGRADAALELNGDGQFFGAASDAELERPLSRVERREQIVGRRQCLAAGVRQDVALAQSGLGRRAVFFDAAHQETV